MPGYSPTTTGLVPAFTAEQTVQMLPNDPYELSRQPQYPNAAALLQAIDEVQGIGPIVSAEEIEFHRETLGQLAQGRLDTPLILSGRCAAPVYEAKHNAAVAEAHELRAIAVRGLGSAIHETRYAGQNAKPRTNALEKHEGGHVTAFMGEGINGEAKTERTPDPRRMVLAAEQAKAVHTEKTDSRLIHAHEALLLPYELAQVYRMYGSGALYLASSHHMWGGERTRNPDGAHIQLLGSVQNAVGVKLGPATTEADIIRLEHALNPDNLPGKVTYMVRMNPGQIEERQHVLHSIAKHAEGQLILWDCHGITRTGVDGHSKIRCVPEMIDDVWRMSAQCHIAGIALHGVHIETKTGLAKQCVDSPNDIPEEPGGIDPQLNPAQTVQFLGAIAGALL